MADQQVPPPPSKLHVDSDWKAEAQREKERLAQKEQARPSNTGGGKASGELPEASFQSLVSMLASQAVMGLGAVADPQTNRIIIDLEGAKFSIDILDVLEQKTKGNLTEDEAKDLRQILAELRSRFVQIAQLLAKQMAAQQAAPATAAPSPIIQPG